jgi:hypothetical protein
MVAPTPLRCAGVIPDEVVELIDHCVHSVWALELLLFLRQHRASGWTVEQLQTELRASRSVVTGVLPQLMTHGLVVEADQRYRYNENSTEGTVAELDRLYRERPVSIIREIALIPSRRIQGLADAFKFRKD